MADLMGGLSGVGGRVLNVGVILVIIVLAIAIFIGLFFFLKSLTKYRQFRVVVWERLESGGIRVSSDKAGIFLNSKTGNKLFYLKKLNVGLKPDNLKYLVDAKGGKVVYLLRYGFKNFSFINPVVNSLGDLRFIVGEEDVNWAVNSYEANKKRFSQSLLFQLLPFMVLALVCIIILILMISLFKQFSVFSDVANALEKASGDMVTIYGGGKINAFNNTAGSLVTGGGVI